MIYIKTGTSSAVNLNIGLIFASIALSVLRATRSGAENRPLPIKQSGRGRFGSKRIPNNRNPKQPVSILMYFKGNINNEHGLTLIEMITTMAILAIVISTAVPNFTVWRNSYQLRAETERVHMDLLSARMTAMKAGNNVVVTFNSGTNSFNILNDTNNNGTADTGEPLRSRVLENNVQFGFVGPSIFDMDGTARTETVVMGASDIVVFDPRGQASLSGVLFLIHNNHFSEGTNNHLRGISITQATGAAELWKYNAALNPPWE